MTVSEDLIGLSLKGRRKSWAVRKKIILPDNHSGGNRSIAYEVESPDGTTAFMKASDPDLITEETADKLERMQEVLSAHQFERKILDHCRGNNMDRVVVAIDYGDVLVTVSGTRHLVVFLVFELAQCDMRVQVSRETRFDMIWTLGALHNLAVAIRQLHAGGVCHNDIKPSNFLVFEARLQKLADLGCATSPLMPASHDQSICVGDPEYAAPEVIYSSARSGETECSFESRRASDIYHLGSMTFFMVCGRMLTPEILRRLPPDHHPTSSDGSAALSFDTALPYWREALSRVLEDFSESMGYEDEFLATHVAPALRQIVAQLGEPDPLLRGHPLSRASGQDHYSVERYISIFDAMRLRLLVAH